MKECLWKDHTANTWLHSSNCFKICFLVSCWNCEYIFHLQKVMDFCFYSRWSKGNKIFFLTGDKKKNWKNRWNNGFQASNIRQQRTVIPERWEINEARPMTAWREFPDCSVKRKKQGGDQWTPWVEEMELRFWGDQGTWSSQERALKRRAANRENIIISEVL